MSNDKINTRSDAQDEFRWFLSQDGKGVLVQARYAGVWVPAAEVSVSEAKLAMKMCSWQDSPLLFDVVEEICAELVAGEGGGWGGVSENGVQTGG